MPESEQISMFAMPEQEEPANGFTPGQQLVSREIIDAVLSSGTNTPLDTLRICAKFSRDRPLNENAEYLQKTYGTDGKGLVINGRRVSMWTDADGIRIAFGDTARIAGAARLSWEDAARRIRELLDFGGYVSQPEIDYAGRLELQELGQRIWLDYRDELGALPSEWELPAGFPEGSEKLAEMLADANKRAELRARYQADSRLFEGEHPNSRLRHRRQATMAAIRDLEHAPLGFQSSMEPLHLERFITQDEVDQVLRRAQVENGEQRILAFFREPHTDQERERFLRNEYGTGGYGSQEINIDYGAKGMRIVRGNPSRPEAELRLNWRQAARRIRELIREGKYVQREERAEPSAPDVVENLAGEASQEVPARGEAEIDPEALAEYRRQKRLYPEAVILVQEKDRYLTFGEDANLAAAIWNSRVREADGEAVTGFEPADRWSSHMLRLWSAGHDVRVIGRGENGYELVKERSGADYLPRGFRFEMDGREYTIDSVNFDRHTVSLQDAELRDLRYPVFREMPAGLVHDHIAELDSYALHELVPRKEAQQEAKLSTIVIDLTPRQAETVSEPTPVPVPAANYRIRDDHLGEGGIRTKADRNIEAIRTLARIEGEGRAATPEEQEVLAQYTGWGGIPQIFDEENGDWNARRASLKGLLNEAEYASARASTLNAHYTSPIVIRAMYRALENMGFEAGKILEPSCGVGNFFGALPESMRDSRLSGVELDGVTGRIARQLYPDADIRVQGFETTNFPDNFFDVAVGNVPFGAYKVPDRRYDRHNLQIHDYFFYKTLDKVRPGGVITFVTSKGTLDKRDSSVRRYIAERADLLGAIRLPNDAFLKNANTGVTTDIVFLQKRGEPNLEEPSWVNVGKTEDGVPVNRYFLDHPDMMLGTMRFDRSMYGNEQETTCEPIEGARLEEQLQRAIGNIRGDYQKIELVELEQDEECLPADPGIPDYSYGRVDGKLYYRENSIMRRVHVPAKTEKRICAMIELRDLTRELLNAQLENRSDGAIAQLQDKLNKAYDAFVAEYGRLSSRSNAQTFDADDGYYLLSSLEILDDERNFKSKADLFDKRTIRPSVIPDHVDTAQEALILSMSERGKVDFAYMSSLTEKQLEDLVEDLRGLIFQDPSGNPGPYEQWLTADEYLSGNVRQKLSIARAAESLYPGSYAANVAALEEVQPKDLEPHEIDVRLGATWIPTQDVQQFMYELLGTSYWQARQIRVNYCAATATWNITHKSLDPANVRANTQYGTTRANAYKLIEEALNLRDVKIFDTIRDADGNEKRVLNQKETILAQQKQAAIREAFRDWIWTNPQRRERLCRMYNDRFNNLRLRRYDGSNLRFSGLNPEIALRPHQKDAVARILYGGNTLLAHVVGAGKTAVMVSGIMEKKRLGLSQKALVVVPNHLTQQTAAEFLRFYPAAKVLVATKKDFEKANRKRFIARIATGDYDAIIMGHSQFEKVPVSTERQQAMLQDQIDEIVAGIEEVKRSNGERFTVKQLERTRRSLEARLKKLNSDEGKDQVINFEQLGVDMLVVDEAHSFKNCAIVTKMRNVAGIQTAEAKKSSDMLMKCRYISEKTGNSGVVFATGTPISNSMVEMYNMQRYLQNDILKERGVAQFDQWASTFGETQTAIELAPEGSGYRSKTRFSKFYNLPELISMFRMTADVQTADMLKLPVPALKGGQVQNIRTEPSEFQRKAVAKLGERAEEVRRGTVDPREDNMLAITNDGRLLALDARLIDPNQPDDPNSKVNACVRNVLRIYGEGAEKRTTQLIFSDLSTPRSDGGFDVYNDIKKKLVEHGVPEEEIAFIHDANNDVQKEALFARVRSGSVRVLLGSTARMGAGTNVQQRLVALHHLDVPWRPSDLQQREGRILRQGNENPEVEIFRYVTEGTFDAYSYQLVESKQKFIAQVFTSKAPVRGAEDTDEVALSYAEVKALAAGNPRVKEKMDLDVQVAKLRLLKSSFAAEQYHLEHQVRTEFPAKIAQARERIANLQADIQRYAEHAVPDSFSIEFMNRKFDKRADAAEFLSNLAKLQQTGDPVRIGSICGFDLYLEKKTFTGELVMEVRGKHRHYASLGESELGNITRIENVLKELPEAVKKWQGIVEQYQTQLAAAKENLAKPFPQEEELQQASARLVELNAELDVGGSSASTAALDDGGDEQEVPDVEREPIRRKKGQEER